jgi:hypothetical protein
LQGKEEELVLQTGELIKSQALGISSSVDGANPHSYDLLAFAPEEVKTVGDILNFLWQNPKNNEYQAHLILKTEVPMQTARALRTEAASSITPVQAKASRGRKKAQPPLGSSPQPSPSLSPAKQPARVQKREPIVKTEKQSAQVLQGGSHGTLIKSVSPFLGLPA